MEYYDGQILKNPQEHKDFANWTNSHGNKFSDIANGDGTYTVYEIPPAPAPTKEQQSKSREYAYKNEVDGITAHISRLRDEEQTEEIVAEISELVAERRTKVEEIKARYPYPTDPITEEPVVEEPVEEGGENA